MPGPKGESDLLCFQNFDQTVQNYQNLEREALGTIWGKEKFHYFLYVKEFTPEATCKYLQEAYD